MENTYGNHTEINVTLKRIDLCDIALACIAAKSLAGDEGKKWDNLREKVHAILKAEDEKHNF